MLGVLGGARAQGGGCKILKNRHGDVCSGVGGRRCIGQDSPESKVLACARRARRCSRSGWFWGILVSKFLCIRFCVLILQYQELDSLVPYDPSCSLGPLRIYEFSYPEYDSGYPCPAHVRKCLDDCRAALARNPSLQLVVIGYRCYPVLSLHLCPSPFPAHMRLMHADWLPSHQDFHTG